MREITPAASFHTTGYTHLDNRAVYSSTINFCWRLLFLKSAGLEIHHPGKIRLHLPLADLCWSRTLINAMCRNTHKRAQRNTRLQNVNLSCSLHFFSFLFPCACLRACRKKCTDFFIFLFIIYFFNCRGNAQLTQLIIKPPLSCLPTQGTASPLPPPPHSPFCDSLYEELSHYFAPRLMKLQPTCTKILLRVFLLLFCWVFFATLQ